ncbi:MAG: starch-binding protein, partial [Eubacteriales bacterium]|nr:starch-binding protein [Eubacteriales bacterium]
TNPTNPTTPTTPTTPGNVGSGEYAVYCKNTAGWSSVSIYMWNSDTDNNSAWPGKTATNIGDNVWMITVDKAYKNVIFNNGSGTQTGDLNFPGSEYIYDNSTGKWEVYDLTKLRITSATADPAAPQYTGVEVKLSMEAAGGEGDLQYQFAVDSTVISAYSPLNTATWTPTEAGNYTIKFSVKDSAGETIEKTMTFQVKDINAEVKPVVQTVSVTPTNSENNEIEKGKVANIDITAGGGNTGTKLLFYKVKITDPKGNVSNVPYYTTGSQYKFTPTALGTYEIEVSVQGSDNSTVTRTYQYECVDKLSAPGELKVTASVSGKQTAGSTVVITASASGGVAPYTYEFKINGQTVQAYSSKNTYSLTLEAKATYEIAVSAKDSEGKVATKTILVEVPEDAKPTDPTNPTDPIVPGTTLKGDADCDGKVNVKDATAVQKHVAGIEKLSAQGMINAEVDGNDSINVKDATAIQKKVAGIITQW